jgi:hypothetical protein
MAYNPTMFVDFSAIKVAHFDGFDPKSVLERVLNFFSDPANSKYKLIQSHVGYFQPNQLPPWLRLDSGDIESSYWVEVSIIYTEG